MSNSSKPPLLLFFFGLPFFLIGCAAAYHLVIKPLALINRAQGWVETPAQILDIKLKSGSSSKGGTTYGIDIRYQYEFNGQTHISERFNASSGTDNISDYHPRNYRHYKRLFDQKQTITCYVNSNDPADAIIDRAPRFEQIAFGNLFAFLFPLVGLFLMLGAFAYRDTEPAPDARQIPLNILPLYFFIIPTALTLAYTFFLFSSLLPFQPSWPWFIWLLLLPAIILTLVCLHRISYTLANRGSRLDLTQSAALGETLSASLHLPGQITNQAVVKIHCKRKETSGSGKSRTTYTSFPWQADVPATAYCDGRDTTLSFRVALPIDETPTSPPGSNPSYTWQVVVKVKRSGRRTQTLAFDLHVSPASPETLAARGNSPALPHADDFSSLAPLLKNKGVTLTRHNPHCFELVFQRSATGTLITGYSIGFLVLGIVASLVLSNFFPRHTKIFWTGFGILFLTAPTLIVFFVTHIRGILCDTASRAFTVWSKRRFIPRSEHVIPFDLVDRFDTNTPLQSSDGNNSWHAIRLQTTDKTTHTVSSLINNETNAKTLASFLNAQIQK